MSDDALTVRHLVKGLGPGGAERLIVTQVTNPHRSDRPIRYDVVYLLAHKDHLVPELRRAGIGVRCLDAKGSARPGWIRRLRNLLRDEPVDIVHVHSPVVAAVTRVLVRTLRRADRPVIVGTEHNRWPRHRWPTRLANRVTIGWQDATIAVSDDVRTTMSRRSRARADVIVHGIDLDRVRRGADRAEVRHELGIPDDELFVLCVANLRREKAIEVLIAAAEQAIVEAPALYYAIVGQGPMAQELADLIAESPAAGRISLLGYRRDATRVMSGADIFTLSSRHEGLPVAIMEALALGLPIAATAAGGVGPAVGDAGLLVPVDDAAALARAHVELAGDIELRTDLGARARARSEQYSADRAIPAIVAIYERALAPTGATRAPNNHS